MKTEKGAKALQENWEDNYKILKKQDESSSDYAKAVKEVSNSLEEMFGYKPSNTFFESQENLALIDDIANGSTEALKKLHKALGEDFILNFDYSSAIRFDKEGN
jgi:hypothetical protein